MKRTTSALHVFALLLLFAAATAQAQSQPRGDVVDGLDVAALVGEAHRNGARMAGAVWIDVAERVVLRLEAWPATERDSKAGDAGGDAPSASSNREDPAVVYEEVKVGEGIWMRGLSRIDTTRAPAFFDRVNVYFEGVFSDYRRFGTEFDGYKLTTPKTRD